MVDWNVKAMSVHASPAVKKMIRVSRMALGWDQKNASTAPVRAPISHSAIAPTRMPICVVTIAQAGQSLWTGRRREGLAAAACDGAASLPAWGETEWGGGH